MLEIHAEVRFDLADDEIEHLAAQTRVYADPEGVVHHGVGVGHCSSFPVRSFIVANAGK